MASSYKILIMGASYGSLLATKLLLGGHTVKLMCMPAEAELINKKGTRVRMPVKGQDKLVEIDSRELKGNLSADIPQAINPADFDLVALAMQEPQYRAPEIQTLLKAISQAKLPCMSIMNMPPPPYLSRLPGFDAEAVKHCYTDSTIWDSFEPGLMTLCSPDPQAFRPPEEEINVLQVSLPTNFKVGRFDSDEHTAMLRQLQTDIEAIRFKKEDDSFELPVKLKVHESLFVPLAKWSMLMTGNYRCVQKDEMRSIKDAVHGDLQLSKSVYNWVNKLCRELGASEEDQVPFEKYAKAALGLVKPSSAARALFNGAVNIERTDCLVKNIAAQKGMQSDIVDETVALVDARLIANRQASQR
ncbi:MAG: hypothetical protein HQM13_03360 [SAR324 cluster bacterium]|nr:hypothetical protein [SAR324 cluster bacterium]